MAEYEYNADLWHYRGREYKRGDIVTVPSDLDDDGKAFIEQLVEEGTLVEPGHAEKLRKDQEKADAERAEWEAEQVERSDQEAHRRVQHSEARLNGSPLGDNNESDAGSDTSGGDKPKPGPRRTTSK